VPLYDYDCAACGRRFEVIHGLNDPAPEHCPLCGKGPVRKAFAAPAIHFKGSGWAKKERRAATKGRGSSPGGGDSGDTGEKRDTADTSGESSKPADPASSSKGGSASTSATTSRPAADTARSSD
jgi:putative FmdB family regulatory protein